MQKRTDEGLAAYLDGELDPTDRGDVEAWLASDPSARDRLLALAETDNAVRAAFAEIAAEPVPERLIAAARGESGGGGAEVVVLRPKRPGATMPLRRWHAGFAAAAGICGLIIGGGASYYALGVLTPSNPALERKIETAAANANWLDSAAGDYKLFINAGGNALVDVPASGDSGEALQKISQSLPQQVRLPDLKPWGLTFRGARLVVIEGRPAAQLIYNTDNKAIGPLALIIGSSKQPDVSPTLEKRQDLNLLYWRHQGRASVLVGQTEIGYLWGIANDVAWQLDAI